MFDWYDALNSWDESSVADAAAPAAAEAASTGATDMSGFYTPAKDAAGYFGNNAGGSYGDLGSGMSGLDATSMGDLFNTNANIGSGMGDAYGFGSSTPSASGSGGFLDSLGSGLGSIGEKLINPKDPLSSVAKLIGALGLIRNATGHAPSDLPKVQALFDQGKASPYKAPNTIQARAPIQARPAASFIAPTGPLSQLRKV
jgi:hypothetical protein